MENDILNISLWQLVLGILPMIIPILLFVYYKVKVVNDTLIALVRMMVQLALVAVYLEWIFTQNSIVINLVWFVLMVFVSVFTTLRRIKLPWRYFMLPFFLSTLVSVVVIDAFFLGWVIKLDYLFDARYFIPITGMILGNMLKHNIVGLGFYFRYLSDKENLYYFLLTHTGERKQAQGLFIKEAILAGLNPLIATISIIGLISLPGMMTGQILGGSSPVVAIKYQIMIMIAIFVGCTLSLFLSIIFSNTVVFDDMGRINLKKLKHSKG